MRIFFHAAQYASHARVAADYALLLQRAGAALVRDPSLADVYFLHHEPHVYPALLDQAPKKFTVGFAVYEATPIPEEYVRGIQRVDELWVPSEFCRAIFSAHHPRVRVVPHPVGRSPTADRSILDAVRLSADNKRLIHIGRILDRRKGTEQLLRVFAAIHREDPRTELLLKNSPQDPLVEQAGVVQIRQTLSDPQITALYAASQIYLSPHSGEGWGLTLSDALLFGLRAVATAWSGNLDFMLQADGTPSPLSLLVPATVESIRARDSYGFFRADQQWAYASDDALCAAIKLALSLPPPGDEELAGERKNLARFSPAAVLERIKACVASSAAAGRRLKAGRDSSSLKQACVDTIRLAV